MKTKSVIKLTQEGHTPLDPMFLRLVRGYLHTDNKVCGVSGGRQHSSAITGLVERGGVGGSVRDLVFLTRLRPDLGRDR